jgi:hypothetical protein
MGQPITRTVGYKGIFYFLTYEPGSRVWTIREKDATGRVVGQLERVAADAAPDALKALPIAGRAELPDDELRAIVNASEAAAKAALA